jgi:GrpB-like predicted nucleotidyltransferase (UPF0157 family)
MMSAMDDGLRRRLRGAGIDPDGEFDAVAAFAALLVAGGDEPTIDDRYSLEAASRGVTVERLSPEARRAAMEDFFRYRWEGFELVGTQRSEPIEVVPYDLSWPRRFSEWSTAIAEVLGAVAQRIDHVGSTAVPGLPSKPVVDIQVGVVALEEESSYAPALEALGVSLRSRDAAHRYFRPPPGLPRVVHVHVCRFGGAWEREHLLFRDYLRAHDDVRDAYGALKRELATQFADDRIGYTEAKGAFIRSALQAAEQWQAGIIPG